MQFVGSDAGRRGVVATREGTIEGIAATRAGMKDLIALHLEAPKQHRLRLPTLQR